MSGREGREKARRPVGRSGVVGAQDLCDRRPVRIGEHVLDRRGLWGRLRGDRLARIGRRDREELVGGGGRLRPH
ncbi:MAG: hypothetical protein ACJ79V_20930, partial [Myxococcales bacterium]